MTTAPGRPGWYPDPLKPATQERRWDGAEWTDDTREASVTVADAPLVEPPESEQVVEQRAPATRVEERGTSVSKPVVETSEAEAPTATRPARRATIALVLAIVILVAVAALQAAYLWGPLKDEPQVSSASPVLLSEPAHRSAVDTARVAVEKLTTRSYQNYDEQVDEATAMMTTAFAETYRETTDQVKAEFVAAETEVTVAVEAQSVMTASESQVEALIFLTQFTAKSGEETAFTPYRIKVTMIDTDQGWLVSDVETA